MITPSKAKFVLEKRSNYKPKPILLDPNFVEQNKFIEDPAKYIVAQCSRRAGKTNGLAIRFFKTMAKYPKSQCVYLGLTRESAKDIMWGVLQELNTIHNLGCTFVESTLTMTDPGGAKLKLFGADMKNFIKRLKGRKFPGIAIDEAQDFGTHLESLLNDVLTPCIADYKDGWIALTGTPGPVPQGYFFEIAQNKRFGYSFHEWTLLQNPYMPDPEAFIKDLVIKREWKDNNPTLLREWRNKWVLDVQALWVRYSETVNHFQTLPQLPTGHTYQYVLGVDIGYKDADALAVLAFSDHSAKTYLIHETITPKQGITELAEQIEALRKVYDFNKIVMDAGALGKKIQEELIRRFRLPVEAADKARKQENVEILNDALRLGNLMAKSGSRFAQDSYLVQIDWDKSTPDKIVIKKKPHSDIIDAVLYAFKLSPAYTYEPTKPKPKEGSPEWAKEEAENMREDHIERIRSQLSANDYDPYSRDDY